MPRTAIVLQVRMGSTRLPGKALSDLGGRPVLEHCVERLRARSGLPVVLATTTRAEDDCLELLAGGLGVPVVRGADADVLARIATVVSTLGLTEIVRATGDNPAVDMDAPLRTLDLLRRTGADHVVERGLPYGTAVEAITATAILRAAEQARDAADREHVTTFIKRERGFRAIQAIAPAALRRPSLRLTVDTIEDLAFLRALFHAAGRRREPVPLDMLIAVADRFSGRAAATATPARECRAR